MRLRASRHNALFRLAFATATPHGLTSPHTITRRLILQKARGHFTQPQKAGTLPRLVGTRFQVLFHYPSPGCFSPFPHGTCPLSVTREYLGLGGGPPRFTRDSTGPVLLGIPLGSRQGFAYRGITFCADDFHASSATNTISHSPPDQQLRPSGPATPDTQRLPAITRDRFSLIPFRSPLLRESRLLSLPMGTEMFHFPTLPPLALCVQARVTGHYARRVPPFGNPRIQVWLPTPRGLSQVPTSFIGSWYQGIHRVPLLTWQLQMMLASTVQFSRNGRHPEPTPPESRKDPVRHEETPQNGRSLTTQQRARPRHPPNPRPTPPPKRAAVLRSPARHPGRITSAPPTSKQPRANTQDAALLLRKEVIQPHLPVRLPCYDFVPIAGPTFDGSLPDGLGHRLRVLPTFVT